MLAFRKPEAVTATSSRVSEDDVRGWYKQIKDYFDENNLFHILSDPRRVNDIVFNWDETNFVLCRKTGLVLSSKWERHVYEVDLAQFKTSLAILLHRWSFSPNKRLPAEIISKIPEDWGVGLSDNGWMNSDIFTNTLRTF